MPDEKPYKYENLPIPSYDEATSSRSPTPSRPDEPSSNAERRGLLADDSIIRVPQSTRRPGYIPPTVENTEDEEFLGQDGRHSSSSEDDEVRQEMEQMEVLDPPSAQSAWTKRISSISQSLSWLRSPFRLKISTWKPRWPKLDASLFIIIARIFAVFLVLAVVYLIFMSGIFTSSTARTRAQMYDPESVREFVQDQISSDRIREFLQEVTEYDHIAGTEGDYFSRELVKDKFTRAKLDEVRVDEYGVYLNYPKPGGRAVELLNADGSTSWSAKLEEEQAYNPPRAQPLVFHGHSKTGSVTGPLIYANSGSKADFKRLYDSGIATKGAIALVKYGGGQGDRALKVKAAELAGFVGCIIYSDPAEVAKGAVTPKGAYLPPDSVQRGSVSLMSWVVGDALTPGVASVKGAPRISKDKNPGLNNIPSIPLSSRDAQKLLQAIKGFGTQCPDEWEGGVPDVEWWSGNLSSPHVHLKNEQDEVNEQPIWNVMGRIEGVEQGEKSIILGNHRDSWGFGATDPGSGTAVMLEVVRVFGILKSKGWRPLRTIEFASWDGEEYNLIGSTEYVEENMKALRSNAIAYINLDTAVSGQRFHAAASPVLRRPLLRVLNRVSDPYRNASLMKIWDDEKSRLEGLGAGSDYVAFQDMAGTSSIDLGFSGYRFPYHSVYDTFEWMDKHGDPEFKYHQVLGQVVALLILELADRPVVPFDMPHYSHSINQYVMDLDNYAGRMGANHDKKSHFTTEPLRQAVLKFTKNAKLFDGWETDWESFVYGTGGFESTSMGAHRMSHNTRMAAFETHLLDVADGGGVPGRQQFKHILFAPQLWSGYDEAYFPFIRDAIEAGDWTAAQKAVEKTATILSFASRLLVENH